MWRFVGWMNGTSEYTLRYIWALDTWKIRASQQTKTRMVYYSSVAHNAAWNEWLRIYYTVPLCIALNDIVDLWRFINRTWYEISAFTVRCFSHAWHTRRLLKVVRGMKTMLYSSSITLWLYFMNHHHGHGTRESQSPMRACCTKWVALILFLLAHGINTHS